MTIAAADVLRPATSGEEWLSMHVFYASNLNPMLTECVAPLVAQLRTRGLIRRYFFIKYWQEGPHVRLRLLPTTPADRASVRELAEQAVDRFLRERPSLFQIDEDGLGNFHRDMYVFEYGEEAWERDYGEAGMPIRPNNSYRYVPYQPEYDRYGGPTGVAVAEWHFEHSSDMVLRLLAATNVHVRTIMLGLAAQLSLVIGYTFRPDPGALALFFSYYQEFWSEVDNGVDRTADFDRTYAEMAESLRGRAATIRDAVLGPDGGDTHRLAVFAGDWATHCRQLRDLLVDLCLRGHLLVRKKDSDVREPMTDPDIMLGILLSGYVHMTNNRLGVGVNDEAYLAHVLRRAVTEIEPAQVPS
jgi:hypothetical protein